MEDVVSGQLFAPNIFEGKFKFYTQNWTRYKITKFNFCVLGNLCFVHKMMWFIDFICTKGRLICILCKITFLYFHMRFGDTNVGWIYIGILTSNVHKIKIKQVKTLVKLELRTWTKLKNTFTKRNIFTLLQSIVTSLRGKWTSISDTNFKTSG